MNKNYDAITCFFLNTFILRRPRVTSIADIIKIATIFIKRAFKGSKKVKRVRDYVLKCNLYLYFGEKMLMSAENQKCVALLMLYCPTLGNL